MSFEWKMLFSIKSLFCWWFSNSIVDILFYFIILLLHRPIDPFVMFCVHVYVHVYQYCNKHLCALCSTRFKQETYPVLSI